MEEENVCDNGWLDTFSRTGTNTVKTVTGSALFDEEEHKEGVERTRKRP